MEKHRMYKLVLPKFHHIICQNRCVHRTCIDLRKYSTSEMQRGPRKLRGEQPRRQKYTRKKDTKQIPDVIENRCMPMSVSHPRQIVRYNHHLKLVQPAHAVKGIRNPRGNKNYFSAIFMNLPTFNQEREIHALKNAWYIAFSRQWCTWLCGHPWMIPLPPLDKPQ